MFEFESKGDMKDLVKLEADLLKHLGFKKPVVIDYEKGCEKYAEGGPIIESEHEEAMWKDLGDVISLQNFPLRTNPFWNMKRSENGNFNKVDVILFGQETIGSAERSCDAKEMRKLFYSIENGDYSEKLFSLFGTERVKSELNDFLSLDFFPRFGGGIGLTRLARAYELNGNK